MPFTSSILSDRTGMNIPGEFEKAIDEVNLLKPDFVMCVGDLISGYTDDEALLAQQWDEVDAAAWEAGCAIPLIAPAITT